MIEARLLHYFLTIAREQNITRAAETLYVTQSTLSKQMMDLEKQLGKKLFIRGNRKITLTMEGIFLRNRAQEILELMDSTESAFRSDSELLSGDITIGCGETIVMDEIADIFAEFHRAHPKVKLHIHSANAETVQEQMDKGLCDFGLMMYPVWQEKYDYIDIHRQDVFGILMPKDCELARQDAVGVEQLKELPLILSAQRFLSHEALRSRGLEMSALNIVATYNLVYNAAFLVERGVGYALCPDRLVNIAGRALDFRPLTPRMAVELFVVTKKYRVFSPAVKVFLEYVTGHFA